MTTSYFNIYPMLTPARVVSGTNIVGVYFNGISNNGVKATLTLNVSTLTIDGVVVEDGDRTLLVSQTSANQNGIYTVSGVGGNIVLTRAPDFQNIEQLLTGQNIAIGAGTASNGIVYTLVEPLPVHMGIDPIVFVKSNGESGSFGTAATKNASDNTQPTVSSVNGATVLNHVLVAADTAGTVKDSIGITAIVDGNLAVGIDGGAGAISSYAPAASSGRILIQGANSPGNFITRITNDAQSLDATYSIPASPGNNNKIGVFNTDAGVFSPGHLLISTTTTGVMADGGFTVAGGTYTAVSVGSGITVPFTGCTPTSLVMASLSAADTIVAIQIILPGTNSFDVLFSGNPGGLTINFIALIQ